MTRRWSAADDEQRFQDDMRLGHRWTLWVARQLQAQGLHGHVPAMKIRGDFEDRASFRDEGDLYVGKTRVEVRSLAARFVDVRTWPYRQVRVDLAGVIESKLKAALILFVSRTGRGIVGLRPRRRDLTTERGVFDRRRGVARDWMVTSKDQLMDFEQCVVFLHERQMTNGKGGDSRAAGLS